MNLLDKLRHDAARLTALTEAQAARIDRVVVQVERLQGLYVEKADEVIRLRDAGDALCRYIIDSGPGLHDDESIVAYWMEVRGDAPMKPGR
jgi:hypothetical protein